MSSRTSNFVLPYEAEATAHREAERRHQEVKAWIQEREKLIESPPLAPDHKPHRHREAA